MAERDRRYGSARWRRLRELVIRRDGGRCSVPDCRADMSEPGMRHVDHVVEVKDGGPFWDSANLRLVCRFHHYEKSVGTIATRATGSSDKPTDRRWCWQWMGADGWQRASPNGLTCDVEGDRCPHYRELREKYTRIGKE